jgi:predicted alpha/beta-fold hydrolase
MFWAPWSTAAKLNQHPGLFAEALLAARLVYAFNIRQPRCMALKNTDDLLTCASAKPHLASIRIPALALNALNDPFIPC